MGQFVDAFGSGSCLLPESCTKGLTDRDLRPLDEVVELDPLDVMPPELDLLDDVTEPSCMTACLIMVFG